MSTLYLARHAQASFFEEDYDQLSELGYEQARRLGQYFVEKKMSFDAVISGPARRHLDTAAATAQAFRDAGLPFPDLEIVPELDEHSADVFLRHSLEELLGGRAELLILAEEYRRATDRSDIQRSFQRLFEAVTKLWVTGEVSAPGVEPYADFHARVCRGLKKTTGDRPGGSVVLAFSSVGPITVILQQSLGLDHHAALQLGWRLRNCNISRFLFSGDRLTLDAFNSVAHLDDDSVTYR